MPEKRLPGIADRAVWEKITNGRAGIRWDNVVEKIWKEIGGDQEDILSKEKGQRKVWRVQDGRKIKNGRKGKASAEK